ERAAADELHHDVRDRNSVVGRLAVVVDPGHVRMRQPGRGLCLGSDHLVRPMVLRQPGREDLDGYLPAEHLVVRAPHHGHAARAEPLDQAVPTAEYLHVPYIAPIERAPTVRLVITLTTYAR